jgi:hypothetical protein
LVFAEDGSNSSACFRIVPGNISTLPIAGEKHGRAFSSNTPQSHDIMLAVSYSRHLSVPRPPQLSEFLEQDRVAIFPSSDGAEKKLFRNLNPKIEVRALFEFAAENRGQRGPNPPSARHAIEFPLARTAIPLARARQKPSFKARRICTAFTADVVFTRAVAGARDGI